MKKYKYKKLGKRCIKETETEFVQMYGASVKMNDKDVIIPIMIFHTDIYSDDSTYNIMVLLDDDYFTERFAKQYKVIYTRVKNIDHAIKNGLLYEWFDEIIDDCLYGKTGALSIPIDGFLCIKSLLKRDITMKEKCRKNENITIEEINNYFDKSIRQIR